MPNSVNTKKWQLFRTDSGTTVTWWRRLVGKSPTGLCIDFELPIGGGQEQELEETVFDKIQELDNPEDFYGVPLFVCTPVSRSELIIDPDSEVCIRLS